MSSPRTRDALLAAVLKYNKSHPQDRLNNGTHRLRDRQKVGYLTHNDKNGSLVDLERLASALWFGCVSLALCASSENNKLTPQKGSHVDLERLASSLRVGCVPLAPLALAVATVALRVVREPRRRMDVLVERRVVRYAAGRSDNNIVTGV
ncbi:hypothetical protein ACJJTC_003171 [Scirpophaga incertulas]